MFVVFVRYIVCSIQLQGKQIDFVALLSYTVGNARKILLSLWKVALAASANRLLLPCHLRRSGSQKEIGYYNMIQLVGEVVTPKWNSCRRQKASEFTMGWRGNASWGSAVKKENNGRCGALKPGVDLNLPPESEAKRCVSFCLNATEVSVVEIIPAVISMTRRPFALTKDELDWGTSLLTDH